jgi:hypothetical protein
MFDVSVKVSTALLETKLPDQPANSLPAAGFATRVWWLPAAKLLPLMGGATVPWPVVCTVIVNCAPAADSFAGKDSRDCAEMEATRTKSPTRPSQEVFNFIGKWLF